MIRTEEPALVVLDLMLPGADGIELMERVPELAGLPVIFISGYRREETIARVLELGAAVELTATEFGLLRALSLEAGRVVTTNRLLRRVWGRRGGGNSERVRTYVKKLRRKLGDDAANPAYIFNKRGVGYRLARPERE